MSIWSNNLKIEIFGTSHGKNVGVVIEGLPAGEIVDIKKLTEFMRRRSPGFSDLTSGRKEHDIPNILSGIENGKTNGKAVKIVIDNEDADSSAYDELKDIPRPGHADYCAYLKSGGKEDMRGGGRFSGRMTAPMCAAGGIALQILESRGIEISAYCDADEDEIRKARSEGDSISGNVFCTATGVPAGYGDALFDGLEGKISSLMFAIPAAKCVEFGDTRHYGSENNDEYRTGEILSNHAGGILGGISSGMPITVRVLFKPTPSISKKQKSVNLRTGENVEIEIKGRHDPCVAVRAVPVVEACMAIAILDSIYPASPRERIDAIDRNIGMLFAERLRQVDIISEYKKENGLKVEDPEREKKVLENVTESTGGEFSSEISELYGKVFDISRKRQY